MKSRTARTREDLKQQLRDQLELLVMGCEHYDAGREVAGKHIALNLRVLLHQTPKSHALLQQLGLRGGNYLDTAGVLNPNNLLTECKLTGMQITTGHGARHVPLVLIGGGAFGAKKVPFAEWWNNAVVKDKAGRNFNRRDLILNVSNTDGGAHVDPELDDAYLQLSRQNSLGWEFNAGNGILQQMSGPELACTRQIAHEVLSTLAITASWAIPHKPA
ncbi:hypothetical protein [Cupriavidus oxalaticus]|uniref:hypothetical protein n=1 Tax=Cupriavidus oxalaticus TaxID=96344 RepID=UPI003178E4AD